MGADVRTSGARRARAPLAAAALVAAAAVVLAACGSGNDTATAPTSAPAPTESSVADTPTTEASTESTATPGAVAGAATLGSETDDDRGGGRSGARSTDEPTGADEVAPGVTWSSVATDYRGEDGLWVGYDCPAGGAAGGVWGTVVYTDDSSVCTAAVHAGLITEIDGGEVVIEISAGLTEYEGSTANGITTLPYGSWSGSFTFVEP
jgi:hypothetical protein